VEPHVTTRVMAGMRLLSATVELTAAWLMARASLPRAVAINAALGMVGPLIFAGVSAVGITGLAGRVSPARLALAALGVALVLWSTRIG
jgi:hypothetical protein